jgi:hypothetical protein
MMLSLSFVAAFAVIIDRVNVNLTTTKDRILASLQSRAILQQSS